MKSAFLLLLSLVAASAFVVKPAVNKHGITAMSMIMPDAPAPTTMEQAPMIQGTNYLEQQKVSSINQFMPTSQILDSSSNMLSLKDRPPPPTAEEIAAKKRNFNFWFWGGGFVAPFLATFYYFGLKFWEK
mmetsp:Transcript_23647/g.29796  ORF Transcript_23647/g.29796 Transcript_23647/m.29796 type:complete len:130 (+) Transcript_23647:74-463(+)|eukprot:CAMPEP_0203655150 /NCGR_PEP_ID=MMETSP0088-20131115/37336_1 /ASSEMBLY_ACC=CAM_ASM_001087 /TAXON_ID=426623 /ORGANISM="Chaetoceros affinis, Strain CCMP159" /LENGTH=129 /DNA_ID=CAMNT_0050515661 /DNA_START=81 /DNA_END=470 /DNA_ORIENTATION=-